MAVAAVVSCTLVSPWLVSQAGGHSDSSSSTLGYIRGHGSAEKKHSCAEPPSLGSHWSPAGIAWLGWVALQGDAELKPPVHSTEDVQ